LDFRNASYSDWFDKDEELSEVVPAIDVARRLQTQLQGEGRAVNPAPWVASVLEVKTPPGPITPQFNQQTQAQIDSGLEYFAKQSDSKRFIVRNGDTSGHFQTLVYEPGKNPAGPWTLLNSSKASAEDRLPNVQSGHSPAELLGALGVRNAKLFIWTQTSKAKELTHEHWQAFGEFAA
jgi:hypothetical protein